MAEAQKAFLAVVLDDGRTLVMADSLWHMSCPIGDLVKWVAFYRKMRDRLDGKYAHFYVEPVAALERLATRLGMALPAERKGKR